MINKYFKYLAGALIIAAIVVAYNWHSREPRLVVLDVGQGDAIYIAAPNGRQILIDGGPDHEIIAKLDKELGFGHRHLDLVILTHEHADHKTGWLDAIRYYHPETIIFSAVEAKTILPEIKSLETPTAKNIGLDKNFTFDLGGNCQLELWPPPHPLSAANSHSLSQKLTCPSGRWLGTGDLETNDQERLLESGLDLRAEFFKAAHHGADSAASPDFLKAVNPTTIAISVGINNTYGHPGHIILQYAKTQNIKILRTDRNGDICWKLALPPP